MRDYDSQSDHDAEKIFKALDSDQKGKIYFQDFLWAAMDIEKVLTPENLLHAFNTFAGEEHKQIAEFLTKDNLTDFFDVSSDFIDIRRSSNILQNRTWDEFFTAANPAQPDRMTYVEFSGYLINQIEE